MTINMIHHHKQQHRRVHSLEGYLCKYLRRMRNQIDNMPADNGSNFRRRLRTETKLGIACKRLRKGSAGFCPRQSEPRPFVKTGWQ